MEKEHYFLAGQSASSRGWKDSANLPARVANQSEGFGSSCPFTELAGIIKAYPAYIHTFIPRPQGAFQ